MTTHNQDAITRAFLIPSPLVSTLTHTRDVTQNTHYQVDSRPST
nr:MAG TPA: hypothetical protein [Caudoviricetes sp.]